MSSNNHVVNLKTFEDFSPLKKIEVSSLRVDAEHRNNKQFNTIISSTVFAIFVGGTSTVTVILFFRPREESPFECTGKRKNCSVVRKLYSCLKGVLLFEFLMLGETFLGICYTLNFSTFLQFFDGGNTSVNWLKR